MIGPTPTRFTEHAARKLRELGVTRGQVDDCLDATPRPSTNWPGQWRFCAGSLCLVSSADGVIITAYLNQVKTPLRKDQIAAGVVIKRR